MNNWQKLKRQKLIFRKEQAFHCNWKKWLNFSYYFYPTSSFQLIWQNIFNCYIFNNTNLKQILAFFIRYTFVSNTSLKLARNQVKAKQHPQAIFLLFENYLLTCSTLSSKNNKKYSKKCTKNKYKMKFKWNLHEVIRLMTMKMRLKKKKDNKDTT